MATILQWIKTIMALIGMIRSLWAAWVDYKYKNQQKRLEEAVEKSKQATTEEEIRKANEDIARNSF